MPACVLFASKALGALLLSVYARRRLRRTRRKSRGVQRHVLPDANFRNIHVHCTFDKLDDVLVEYRVREMMQHAELSGAYGTRRADVRVQKCVQQGNVGGDVAIGAHELVVLVAHIRVVARSMEDVTADGRGEDTGGGFESFLA